MKRKKAQRRCVIFQPKSSGHFDSFSATKLYPLKGQGFCANRDATRNASLVLTAMLHPDANRVANRGASSGASPGDSLC